MSSAFMSALSNARTTGELVLAGEYSSIVIDSGVAQAILDHNLADDRSKIHESIVAYFLLFSASNAALDDPNSQLMLPTTRTVQQEDGVSQVTEYKFVAASSFFFSMSEGMEIALDELTLVRIARDPRFRKSISSLAIALKGKFPEKAATIEKYSRVILGPTIKVPILRNGRSEQLRERALIAQHGDTVHSNGFNNFME